jgi:4-hydroxy-2-oxoheptanedioate aldolase
VLIPALHLTDPAVYELTSLLGFDGIWLDLEHHATSIETAARLMRAARVGVSDVIARPGKGEMMRMQRMLEAGAHGIMYPRCDSVDEAREVVGWMKFAPEGRRGFDGSGPDMPYLSMTMTDYTAEANRQTFLVLQIETPEAIEQVDRLAQVDGVDVLMLGPADFSLLSGIPGQFDHPSIHEAKRKIADAARGAGKHWACPVSNVATARESLEMGARMLFYRSDIRMLVGGLSDIQKEMGPLGFEFDQCE